MTQQETVVIIRVWRDGGAVRGRVVFEQPDGRDVSTPAASVEELCELARHALDSWAVDA